MKHSELVEIGRQWLLGSRKWAGYKLSCSVVITEMTSRSTETPDVLGFEGSQSVLLECKTSLSDFKAEQKKPARRHEDLHPGVGNFRYYFAPKGVIPRKQLPDGWGLIEVDENKKVVIEVFARLRDANKKDEIGMLVSLIRRLGIKELRGINVRIYTYETGKQARASATIICEDEDVDLEHLAGTGFNSYLAALPNDDFSEDFKNAIPCKWTADEDGTWFTTCDNAHVFFDGGPNENKYKHCPYCGQKLEEQAYSEGD